MITCTLNGKKYAVDFITGRALREMEPAAKMYSRIVALSSAALKGETPEDAKELLRRLKGLPAHFNLIPLNHVEESPLKPSTRAAVAAFQKTLEDGGVTATVRRTLGGDIDASCGQLRRKAMGASSGADAPVGESRSGEAEQKCPPSDEELRNGVR